MSAASDTGTVAIMVEPSPDISRLGFPEREIERAYHVICRFLIRRGRKIMHIGHLEPGSGAFQTMEALVEAYFPDHPTPFSNPVHLVELDDLLERTDGYLERMHGIVSQFVSTPDGPVSVDGSKPTELRRARAYARDLRKQRSHVGDHDNPRRESHLHARYLRDLEFNAVVLMGGDRVTRRGTERYITGGMFPLACVAARTGRRILPVGAYGGMARDIAVALDYAPPLRFPAEPHDSSYFEDMLDFQKNFRHRSTKAYPELVDLGLDDRPSQIAKYLDLALQRRDADWPLRYRPSST